MANHQPATPSSLLGQYAGGLCSKLPDFQVVTLEPRGFAIQGVRHADGGGVVHIDVNTPPAFGSHAKGSIILKLHESDVAPPAWVDYFNGLNERALRKGYDGKTSHPITELEGPHTTGKRDTFTTYVVAMPYAAAGQALNDFLLE